MLSVILLEKYLLFSIVSSQTCTFWKFSVFIRIWHNILGEFFSYWLCIFTSKKCN